jgi:hypothetical protein
MNKAIHSILTVLALTIVVVAGVQAQTSRSLIAEIPFEFKAGDTALNRGRYELRVINPSSDQTVVKITALDSKQSVLLRMSPVVRTSKDVAKLIFNRYGDQYFLAEAWTASDLHFGVSESRAERSARKQLAGVLRSTETVGLKRQVSASR